MFAYNIILYFVLHRIETENSRAAAAAASRGVAEDVKEPIGFIEVGTIQQVHLINMLYLHFHFDAACWSGTIP